MRTSDDGATEGFELCSTITAEVKSVLTLRDATQSPLASDEVFVRVKIDTIKSSHLAVLLGRQSFEPIDGVRSEIPCRSAPQLSEQL